VPTTALDSHQESAMWMRNCWQVIAFSKEVGPTPLARTVLDEPIVLFRTQSGEAVALADRCPHRFAPLSFGRVVGDQIQCGYHGLCFDRDGICVRVPGQDSVPQRARVRKYPLVERHTFAWIWMGDAKLADPDRVPDFHWMDDPAWTAVEGYHHFKANYQLVNDNLLDLSHESFVHEETIGNESVAESPASVTLDGNVVRVHRDMLNIEAPPFYKRTTGFAGRINRWHTNHFTPPGFHVIENGSMPADAPDKSQALERKVLNLITPETPTSSHYFWGIVRQFRLDDRELTDYIRAGIIRTFDQDKAVLEAQQRGIGPDPDNAVFPVSIRVDAGPMQGRKLLNAMIARETTASGGLNRQASR
jgi:phenylpropionate dioxygenase-like ring-hydroxylating dioxygenase large terminal subunit